MKRGYSFKLAHGPLGDETSSIVELNSDAEAIRVGRMLLEHAAKANSNPNGLSVVIGREGHDVPPWVGAWHWDGEAKWVT